MLPSRDAARVLLSEVAAIAPYNIVFCKQGMENFGAAAYRMAPRYGRPQFVAGLHLRMEWSPTDTVTDVYDFLHKWNNCCSLRTDIFDDVPMHMVNTLWFERDCTLLVFGNMVIDVRKALVEKDQYVLARTKERIVSVEEGHVVDETGNSYLLAHEP